jgi:hypothetical protein
MIITILSSSVNCTITHWTQLNETTLKLEFENILKDVISNVTCKRLGTGTGNYNPFVSSDGDILNPMMPIMGLLFLYF